MNTSEPRSGEHVVNTHTGQTKPPGEPFDSAKHGERCYHGTDVVDAMNHWGAYNGRDHDRNATLALLRELELKAGPVREVFHIERYVAVLFENHPDTVGAYINRTFIGTTTQVMETQTRTDRGYWRHEFSGYVGSASGSSRPHASVVPIGECSCSPGLEGPIGSECQYCGSTISSDNEVGG